jgi:hypothetical protein
MAATEPAESGCYYVNCGLVTPMTKRTLPSRLFLGLFGASSAVAFLCASADAFAATATFNFAQVGSSFSAFLPPDDPLIGKEITAARIYLDVESFPGSDAANFFTDISFPIEPFAGNTNAIVLFGSDLGWSGSGTFHYFEETTRFNGVFVTARYGGETPGENFDGLILDTSRIEFDYIDSGSELALESAASEKKHRGAGRFEVDLPLSGDVGIENRDGARTTRLTFTFNNNVVGVDGVTSSCGLAGEITIDPADSHNVVVKLNGVLCDQSTVTVGLNGVTDDQGNSLDSASVTLGILLGDVTGDGVVDNADVAATQALVGRKANSGNFRADINTDGIIDHKDVHKVKTYRGHSLP